MKKSLQIIGFLTLLLLSGNAFGQILFYVEEPPSIEGAYDFAYPASGSSWGFTIETLPPVTDTLVLVDDGTVGDSLGCNALVNANAINNQIAVVYRGDCEFGKKALEAQIAGARAVVIIQNSQDAPFAPGAGAVGGSVTIPVIMISQSDGAIIRAAMDAGTVEAFIGNKQGLFQDDIAISMEDVVLPRSWAIPVDAIGTFEIPIQAWVRNFGSTSQSGVTLNATITKDGNTIYDQTSSPSVTISVGDSALIVLQSPFVQTSPDTGIYTLTYTVAATNPDSALADNQVVTNFWINDKWLSKARMDPTTEQPVSTGGGIRSATAEVFAWCITLNEGNYGGLTAKEFQFALSANDSLTHKQAQIEFYEWQNVGGNDITSDSLIELTNNVIYTYSSDLQNEYITMPLNGTTGIPLEDNSRYLACLRVFNNEVFIVTDGVLDYKTTIDAYQEFIYPIQVDAGAWAAGFASRPVPATAVSFEETVIGIADKDQKENLSPYPNPATENVAVKLSKDGKYDVKIVDVTGKVVHTGTYTTANNILNVRTDALSNGVYYFTISGDDKQSSTFPVVISK